MPSAGALPLAMRAPFALARDPRHCDYAVSTVGLIFFMVAVTLVSILVGYSFWLVYKTKNLCYALIWTTRGVVS